MRIGWKECSIGEVCKSVFAGGDVPKSSFSREKTDKYSVPIFSNGLENNGLYGYTDVPRVVEPCITISGRGTIGQPFLREEPFFPIIRLITAIPKDEIDLRFFYYAVSCIDFKSTGVAIPQLTVPAVKAYTIRFPHDINMQKHIVAEFDCLTGIIEKKKQQLEELDNLAQSIFYDMFGDDVAKANCWDVKALGEIGSFQRGGGFLKKDYVEDGFPCLHYGQIHTRLGVATYKHLTCIPDTLLSKTKIASHGDLIMAITSEDVEGSCKSTAWMGNYDIAVGAHTAIYKHTMNPIFASYITKSARFNAAKQNFTHGIKVVEITPKDIATITIPIPPRDLQDLFAQRIEAIEKQKELINKSIQETETLFNSRMDYYFSE